MMRRPRPRLPRSFSLVLIFFGLALLLWGVVQGVDPVFRVLEFLEHMARSRPVVTALVYLLVFIVAATLALPVGTLMALAGGYLFGTLLGVTLATGGAAVSAWITFVVVRRLAGEERRKRIRQGRAAGMVRILERDAFFYLVLLRSVPVTPFFLVNVAAAICAVPPGRYIVATTIGLVPPVAVLAAVGDGIGSLVQARAMAGPQLLLAPRVALPMLLLCAMLVATFWVHRYLERSALRRQSARDAARSRRSKITPPSDSRQGEPSRERK